VTGYRYRLLVLMPIQAMAKARPDQTRPDLAHDKDRNQTPRLEHMTKNAGIGKHEGRYRACGITKIT